MLLLTGWVVLVLLFFSISDGKRSVYIFPAAPAFALIVGSYMPVLAKQVGVRRLVGAFPILLGLILVAVGMYGLMHPHELQTWLPDTAIIIKTTLTLLAAGIVSLAAGLLLGWRRPFLGTAASLAVLWLGLSLVVAPQINTNRSGEAIVEAVIERVDPGQELALVGWPEQFLLYFDRPVTHFGYRRDHQDEMADALNWLSRDPSREVLVARQAVTDCLISERNVEEVGRAHRRDWLLIPGTALNQACVPGGFSTSEQVATYWRPGRQPGHQSGQFPGVDGAAFR